MCRFFLALLTAGTVFADESALDRLKATAIRAKADPKHADLSSLHRALRDWVESRLPGDKGLLGVRIDLESAMQAELNDAGLSVPEVSDNTDPFDAFTYGYFVVAFARLPELPDTLLVTGGASMPCGVDAAVYLYHFDTLGWKRIVDEHPPSEYGYGYPQFNLSAPDPQGRRLLLVHRESVQCASTWMGMTNSVYRLPFVLGTAERLLSEKHAFWMSDGPEFVLKPDELILEFRDNSVDVGVHNRVQIRRFSFADGIRRLDPVALQPQDFAEEWLTRPWSEMQARSSPRTKLWHDRLYNDFVLADYYGVVPCTAKADRWLVGLEITHIGKELSEPIDAWFVVHDLGNYRYRMEAVADTEPQGCPGTGAGRASGNYPWLTPAELRALR